MQNRTIVENDTYNLLDAKTTAQSFVLSFLFRFDAFVVRQKERSFSKQLYVQWRNYGG